MRWRKWCRDIIVNGGRVDDAKEKPNRYTTEEIPLSGTFNFKLSSRRGGEEVYHIEVSPGRWVITSNKGEAESLFRDLSAQSNPNQSLLEINHHNFITLSNVHI